MDIPDSVTNIVLAGLGGQGVLTGANILADAAFRAGFDVTQSEIHGMSQRGGSVSSDVRYGPRVWSPMVPEGEAHYLVLVDSTQEDNNRHHLAEEGAVIRPDVLIERGQSLRDVDNDDRTPLSRRNLNVALLGVLSTYLKIEEAHWMAALHANLPEKLHAVNTQVFALGRQAAQPG